ncbi:hypothetical protein QQF64_018896 [Cirrhinus molitorella]|uniref:GPR128 GAIN subdomain A domain-containing protein n=1 Tax=Cirrhinus molitorella TaxID=172907 RepID=A0ABR3LFD4_9TELE
MSHEVTMIAGLSVRNGDLQAGGMAANSKNPSYMKDKSRTDRSGNGSETLNMEDSGEEEDDMEVGWTQIKGRTGRKGSKKRKKGKVEGSDSSSITGEEEGDGGNKDRNGFRIIFKFKDEVGISGVNPWALTYELKKLVGEIAFAKILQDGALLIACLNEEQKNRALKLKAVGKQMVVGAKIVGQKSWVYGVINGVPAGVTMEELKKNLNGAKVIDAVRLQMNREGRRVDSLSVLLKIEGKELPERVKMGFISYLIREYIVPPLRCFNCQRKKCKNASRDRVVHFRKSEDQTLTAHIRWADVVPIYKIPSVRRRSEMRLLIGKMSPRHRPLIANALRPTFGRCSRKSRLLCVGEGTLEENMFVASSVQMLTSKPEQLTSQNITSAATVVNNLLSATMLNESVAESVVATISQLMHTDEDQYSEDTYDALESELDTKRRVVAASLTDKNFLDNVEFAMWPESFRADYTYSGVLNWISIVGCSLSVVGLVLTAVYQIKSWQVALTADHESSRISWLTLIRRRQLFKRTLMKSDGSERLGKLIHLNTLLGRFQPDTFV